MIDQLWNRRSFLSAGVLSAAMLADSHAAPFEPPMHPICVFTKPFNSLSYDALADAVASLKFDGIEAPIRKGGHIEPAQVGEQLPALVAALEARKLKIIVMTSDVNSIDDPLTEPVLRTAAKLGIKRYRMKYYKYDPDRPVRDQLKNWKAKFKDLAALNRELGIRGLYQNHAGPLTFGAALWDLREVLDGISPDEISVAYDIRHATVEGGRSWPTTFRMIRPHIDTVYVKDFQWRETGKTLVNVPLGTGRVDPGFMDLLAKTGFRGPISLHEEYLDHRNPQLVPQHLEAIQRDFDVLRQWMHG